ncbi:hypothetical protein JNJ66_03945 [Candidatus Saccharibacteria bacterium]|nr:hypothetical protein [Candidatus Saccharibacteria bacterium]
MLSSERHPYFLSTIQLVNKLEIVLPLLLSLALALIPTGIIRSARYSGIFIIAVIAVLIITVIFRSVFLEPSARVQAFFSVVFHILLAGTLLAITGFDSLVLIFWVGLLILAYINHGRGGFLASYLAILLTAFLDIAIQNYLMQADLTYYASIIIGLIGVSSTAYILSNLISGAAIAHESVIKSRTAQELERDRLRILVNSMSEGVIATDPAGIIRLQNSAVLSILDTNQSFIGKNIKGVFTLTDEKETPVSLAEILHDIKAPTVRTDLTHHFNETDNIRLSLQITPIRAAYHTSSEPGYLVIFRDITREKSLEEERDEFISVVSHELRTPITIAEGSISNLIVLQDRGATPDILKKSAVIAHDQVLFLASMMNDLSTLSRAERGISDQQTQIPVQELVRQLYDKYQPEAVKKGLDLHLDVDAQLPTILQHRLYLEEILQNFVTNAIKYTQAGSVTIHAHVTGDQLEFAVSDTGIGIGKTDIDKIFQKFYRAEDYRTRETSGTGLGLYVVHKLAGKIGTRIEVTSRLNHGSRFSFRVRLGQQ